MTPTFYFFRNKEQVHMHTGANAGKFEKFILENVRERAGLRLGEAVRVPSKIRRRRRKRRGEVDCRDTVHSGVGREMRDNKRCFCRSSATILE